VPTPHLLGNSVGQLSLVIGQPILPILVIHGGVGRDPTFYRRPERHQAGSVGPIMRLGQTIEAKCLRTDDFNGAINETQDDVRSPK